MTIKLAIISMLMLALLAIGLGCTDGTNEIISTNGNDGGAILRVYPGEGATGVATSASVAVKFDRTMDSVSVMNNFFLIGGTEMFEWMDSTTYYGGMGHMSMFNMNHMIDWIDSISMPGTFNWNEALDSCEFVPLSGMFVNQEYMIFMDEGEMMDHNGGMMGSGHTDDQYHSYHFMTVE